jgi:hypothetical protein
MNLNTTLIASLMRGVHRCECGISSDAACGAVKDRLLGYVSLSNHPYKPHDEDGIDKPSN